MKLQISTKFKKWEELSINVKRLYLLGDKHMADFQKIFSRHNFTCLTLENVAVFRNSDILKVLTELLPDKAAVFDNKSSEPFREKHCHTEHHKIDYHQSEEGVIHLYNLRRVLYIYFRWILLEIRQYLKKSMQIADGLHIICDTNICTQCVLFHCTIIGKRGGRKAGELVMRH